MSFLINPYLESGEQLLYDQDANGGVREANDYNSEIAQQFDTGYSFTNITKVVVYLRKFNTPTMNIKIGLWGSADLPNSPTVESDTTLNGSAITTSSPSGAYLPYDFEIPATSLSGNNIKIGIITDVTNASNYIQFAYSTATLSDRQTVREDGSNAWEAQRPQSFMMQVWGG